MKNLKKNLQTVNRNLKALSKKVDKIVVAVGKLEKPKTVKAKPVKKTVAKAKPVKKVAAKRAPVKKVVVKKPAAKKTTKTAADTVLSIIKRYKKGIGNAVLMEKTGYNQKKIANLVFKLRKQGKIKSVAKGVYVKT
jgi:hypothetical protein